MSNEPTYPDQYLRVCNNRTGETFIMEIADDEPLDIEALILKWFKREFGQDHEHVFEFHKSNFGASQYDAAIITDGRPPDTCIVWTSAEFDHLWTA